MVSVIVDRDLEDLIPGYLSNRERDVAKVAEALAAGDFETLRVIGHSMKGSGGGYGFDALSDLGSQIEQAALARNAEASATRRAIVYALFLTSVLGFVVALFDVFTGVGNALVWSTVVIYLFFAAGFGYFAFLKKD